MLLQLIGAYIVWRDLVGSAKDFGQTGVLKSTWIWLKAGFGFPTVVSVSADLRLESCVMAAFGTARQSIDPNAEVTHRLQILELYVKQIDEDLSHHGRRLQETERTLRREIVTAKSELQGLISQVDNKLKDSMIGSYPTLIFGAFWVFIGMILSSLAPDIVKLVAHQYDVVWQNL
jgi:hypothetical protein